MISRAWHSLTGVLMVPTAGAEQARVNSRCALLSVPVQLAMALARTRR